MSVKLSISRKTLTGRVLACLLSVTLVVALCPLQGWSEESSPALAPDQLTEIVPMEAEPEVSQLVKAVPLADDADSAEPEPLDVAAPSHTVKVTFVVSDEPSASWPDATTTDRTVEVPVGEPLGAFVPPTPVSSDDSLVFEGWQTKDFTTYASDELAELTLQDDSTLHAVFSSAPADASTQRAETETVIASGVSGTCRWNIRKTSTYVNLVIGEGTLLSGQAQTWESYKDQITNLVISPGVKAGVRANQLFSGCSKLTYVKGLDNLDTSQAEDTSWMFSNCSSLTSLDLSSWNMAKVKNMEYMFNSCGSLTTLNLSSWDMTSVTDMNGVFNGCTNLVNLYDPTAWKLPKVEAMAGVFAGCRSLKSLDLSSWDTSRITSMTNMFFECSNLESLNLSSWNTSEVTIAIQMFYGCKGLTSLDFSSWNMSNVTDIRSMFFGCSNLKSLNLSSWNISKAASMSQVFRDCRNLTSLNLSSWDLSNVTDMYRMFFGCNSLEEIPSSFTFGATTESDRNYVFDITQASVVVTTYNGADANVKNYDWPSAGRALKGTPLTGSVSVSGNAEAVGQTLTASATPDNACRNASKVFTWYRGTSATDANPTKVATGSAYTTSNDDVGKYIFCKVTDGLGAYTGELSSTALGPVTAPFSATVTVEGAAVVGQTLTANVRIPNTSPYSYKWQRANEGTTAWADIPNATGGTYELARDDFGKIVRCVVKADTAGYTGEVASGATEAVKGVLAGTVSVTGHPYANQRLTASIEGLSQGASAAYKWYTAADAAGTGKAQIAGATASELDLSPLQTQVVGKCIVCEASDSSGAYVNTVSSSTVGPVGIAWGTSGPNVGGCVWTIDAAGAMEIAPAANGQGSLGSLAANSVPWVSFAAQVKSARVAQGVKAGAGLTGMFSACSRMTEVDLSGLDATDATDLSSMFFGCGSLTTVKGLDALKAAKPINLGSMFSGCSSLASLDLSGLAAGTAIDLSAMFQGCSKLSDLKLPAGFVGDSCRTVVNMFRGCNALATIPSTFGFGSNQSIQTAGCFDATSPYSASNLLATTYLGDDLRVTSYNWKSSNRSLASWKLSGEASITGGDDPVADCKLTASAAFTGLAAGLEKSATYQWCTAISADDANPQPIDKATALTYIPRKADVGKFLVCLVSAPSGSGAQGTLRAVTDKVVRAPQVWATVPSRTQVYVSSEGNVSVPDSSAYALDALDGNGTPTEGDVQLVDVKLTLDNGSYPGGSWTLSTPGADGAAASTFLEAEAFTVLGTECAVEGAPAVAPGASLPLQWEASFKNDIGPELAKLLAAADGEGARYGEVEFKVAWKPRV